MASRQYFNNYLVNPDESDLMNAVYSHNYEGLKLLLSSGADAQTKAKSGQYAGRSALFCAIALHDMGLTKILLDFGANVDEINQGITPICYALTHGVPGTIVEILLNFKPNLSIESWGHQTANILAARTASEHTFNKYFESSWVDVNLQSSLGESALISLVKWDEADHKRVEKLLELGANTLLKGSDGLDALEWAGCLKKENYGFYKKIYNLHKLQSERQNLLDEVPKGKECEVSKI